VNTIKIKLGGSLLLAFSAQLSGQQSMAGSGRDPIGLA